jgi:uncharacterized protein (UPF0262 family)
VVKDYFMVCDSYYAAIDPQRPTIEALDMGRAGSTTKVHLLRSRSASDRGGSAPRRLLRWCALHWKELHDCHAQPERFNQGSSRQL